MGHAMVNPEPPSLEPELEDLLREIARDPRSNLLRFPRPPRPIDLARTSEAASRTTPGLTPAERHLLDVHRADTVQFLLDRWLHEVTVRPRVGFALSRGSEVRKQGSPDTDLAKSPAEQLARVQPQEHSEVASIPKVLDPEEPMNHRQLSALILMAERMRPPIVGKVHAASDLVLDGQPAPLRVS